MYQSSFLCIHRHHSEPLAHCPLDFDAFLIISFVCVCLLFVRLLFRLLCCNMAAIWFGLYSIFAPVKWLAMKIVSKITCNVLIGTLNPTILCHPIGSYALPVWPSYSDIFCPWYQRQRFEFPTVIHVCLLSSNFFCHLLWYVVNLHCVPLCQASTVKLTSMSVRRTWHCVTMKQCASISQAPTCATALWDMSVNIATLLTVHLASVSTTVHAMSTMAEDGCVNVLSSTPVYTLSLLLLQYYY